MWCLAGEGETASSCLLPAQHLLFNCRISVGNFAYLPVHAFTGLMYLPSHFLYRPDVPAFWLPLPAWCTRLLILIYLLSDCRYRPDIPASWLPVPAWYTSLLTADTGLIYPPPDCPYLPDIPGLLTVSTCLIESPSDCLYRPDIPAFWLWYTRLLTAYAGLPKWWNYCVIPCLDLPSKPVHKFKPVWFRLQSLYKIPAYLNLPSRRPVHKFLPTWICLR